MEAARSSRTLPRRDDSSPPRNRAQRALSAFAALFALASSATVAFAQAPPRPVEPPPPPKPPPLVIPPVPEVPGANALPEEDPDEARAREEERERQAQASPRTSTFKAHRGVQSGPAVPAAPVRLRQQMHLQPSEAMVADRNALSTNLRVMPFEMRNPSGFTTLYTVDDRPEVLVRGNGAVYAVFPQGDYALANVKKKRVIQTLVPPGTMYYIGEPDWRKVWLPGVRPNLHRETPEEVAAHTPPATALERVEPTMPIDYEGVYLSPLSLDEHPDYAPIDTRIDTFVPPSAHAFAPPPSSTQRDGAAPPSAIGAPSAPVPSASGSAAAPGASGNGVQDPNAVRDPNASPRREKAQPVDERTEPPITSDPSYRLKRMRQLLGEAARQGSGR